MKTKWPSTFKLKTGLMLTDHESDDWWLELDAEIRNLSDDEICAAIRWAFTLDNVAQFKKRSKYDYTQPLLRLWIFMHRKAQREADEPDHAGDCFFCNGKGWMSVPRSVFVRDGSPVLHVCIPCSCRAGEGCTRQAQREKFGHQLDGEQQKAKAFLLSLHRDSFGLIMPVALENMERLHEAGELDSLPDEPEDRHDFGAVDEFDEG